MGVSPEPAAPVTTQVGHFTGKTCLFTGTLTHFNRKQAETVIKSQGGKMVSSVSKNLDFLIVGESAGSKLKKAQAIPTIQILDEVMFASLI